MLKPSIALVAMLGLAACNQPTGTTTVTTNSETGATTTSTTGSDTNTTAAAPSVGSAAAIGLQPGKWETKIEVQEMTVGGKAMPKPPVQTASSCLTPEMASKGPGDMLKQAGADCTFSKSSYSGGKIDVAMTCKMPQGTVTSTSTGTYTPTSMTSDGESKMTGAMESTSKVHTEAKRVGECS